MMRSLISDTLPGRAAAVPLVVLALLMAGGPAATASHTDPGAGPSGGASSSLGSGGPGHHASGIGSPALQGPAVGRPGGSGCSPGLVAKHSPGCRAAAGHGHSAGAQPSTAGVVLPAQSRGAPAHPATSAPAHRHPAHTP